MKRIGVLIVGIVLCLPVIAQERRSEESEVKTLLNKYNEIKGFGAFDVKVTDVASERAVAVGAYGGIIVNKQIMLGLGGYGFATHVDLRRDQDVVNLEGGYGGMILGFIIAPREVVHVSVPLFLGAGSFHQFTDRLNTPFGGEVNIESSSFAVIEPGVQIEVNMSKWLRIGFGASYRYIQGTNFDNVSDSDLSNFAGNIALKIGKF